MQPLISRINPSLGPADGIDSAIKDEKDEIIDLSRVKVLVVSNRVAEALTRLKILILSNPSPGLCRRVLKPVVFQLWTLASWTTPSDLSTREHCNPARQLLQTYLTLFGKEEDVTPLVDRLLCNGPDDESDLAWRYREVDGGGLEIVQSTTEYQPEIDLAEVESKADTLVKMITTVCSNNDISSLFLSMLRVWISAMQRQTGIQIKPEIEDQEKQSPIKDLVRVSVLQKLMELSPEKLVSQFDRLVDIICQVLAADSDTPLGGELLAVVLSLLNLVVTSTSFDKNDLRPTDLTLIEQSLGRIQDSGEDEVAATARNLSMLLKYRDEVEQTPEELTSAPSLRQVEDRRTYNLAMEYITGAGENPPPVVSEGLNMLSTLILAQSPILDVNAVTVLMSTLLKENEDYINLRVIKIFTQLAAKHPKSTIKELLDNYLDPQEKYSTDIRLRFGEALLQVIERLGETFAGDTATQAGETLLSIAGRRGYRPKTMAKQAREERLNKLKDKTIEGNSIEAAPDTPMDEELAAEERANNDIIAQIVQGWESKRGSEDIRMRASALSILGTALELNITGLGPSIASNAVDLSVNVLAVEREPEQAILRRSSIMMILSFIRALSQARETNRSLGFGLTEKSRDDIRRTLEYVADTDNDGLVRQHARDVVESLENWQATSMLPQPGVSNASAGLSRLAGLQVNPDTLPMNSKGQSRPRIEEVE